MLQPNVAYSIMQDQFNTETYHIKKLKKIIDEEKVFDKIQNLFMIFMIRGRKKLSKLGIGEKLLNLPKNIYTKAQRSLLN